jgi:hypothetical protein
VLALALEHQVVVVEFGGVLEDQGWRFVVVEDVHRGLDRLGGDHGPVQRAAEDRVGDDGATGDDHGVALVDGVERPSGLGQPAAGADQHGHAGVARPGDGVPVAGGDPSVRPEQGAVEVDGDGVDGRGRWGHGGG